MACFWEIPSYSFSDILSFGWDAIKAAVPAGVAWVAYKVSKDAAEATQAQRDIAANQYKLSLFEKRTEKYIEFSKWRNIDITHAKLESLSQLKTLAFEVSKLFDDKEINDNCIELLGNLNYQNNYTDELLDIFDIKHEEDRVVIENSLSVLQEIATDIQIFISDTLDSLENKLTVPQEPFTSDRSTPSAPLHRYRQPTIQTHTAQTTTTEKNMPL